MSPLQMNETRWSIARDLAHELHELKVDKNEFKKVTAFMRQYHRVEDALDKFKTLLHQLANSNDAPIQSNQTREYYKNIHTCCQEHLKDINEPNELLLILGWCNRLMPYYEEEAKCAVEEQRPQEQKQTQKQPTMQSSFLKKEEEKPKIKKGDRVNATILKKDGSKVTVQLETDDNEEIVFERPYYPGLVGAKVKLKVMAVNNENGHVTEVIP